MKNLDLTMEEKRVLEMALEFYIRLGLGQCSEIATRLDLLQGNRLDPEAKARIYKLLEEAEDLSFGDNEPWNIGDDEISIYTLTALLLEKKIKGQPKNIKWLKKRIAELKERTKEKIQ